MVVSGLVVVVVGIILVVLRGVAVVSGLVLVVVGIVVVVFCGVVVVALGDGDRVITEDGLIVVDGS